MKFGLALATASLLAGCVLPEATRAQAGGGGVGATPDAGGGGSAGGDGGVGGSGGGGDSYAAMILAGNPISYWRFGEATAAEGAHNEVPGGDDGTYVGDLELGAPGAIADDANTAVRLTGGHVFLTDNGLFDQTEAFTFELWISFPDIPADEVCILGTGVGGHYEWTTPISGHVRFARDDQVDADWVEGDIPTLDDYFHLAVTYDEAALRLYINGTGVDFQPSGSALPSPELALGDCANWPNAAATMDELVVFDRALDEGEVQAHHAAGASR